MVKALFNNADAAAANAAAVAAATAAMTATKAGASTDALNGSSGTVAITQSSSDADADYPTSADLHFASDPSEPTTNIITSATVMINQWLDSTLDPPACMEVVKSQLPQLVSLLKYIRHGLCPYLLAIQTSTKAHLSCLQSTFAYTNVRSGIQCIWLRGEERNN